MHDSGLIKRILAQVMGGAAGAQVAAAKLAAKKPTVKEIHEEEKRAREQAETGTWLEHNYCYC
jgi:hypothetical protein